MTTEQIVCFGSFAVHRTQKVWQRCGSATCYQKCPRRHF